MLTDTRIRAIKPGSEPFKVSDSGGLHLLIAPTGSKLWKGASRYGGKQENLSFGADPDTTLADARTRREEAKATLRQGTDPGKSVKFEKIAEKQTIANT